jgi:hypothetical protein
VSQRAARRHRKKVQRARRQAGRPVDPAELPRPLRLVLEGQQRFVEYLSGSPDREAAVAMANDRLDEALGRLIETMRPHYAPDVAELVTLRNLVADPETYRETEHEGSLAVVELVALVAAAMEPPAGALAGARGVPGRVVDQADQAARDALDAASMGVLFSSAEDPENPLSPIGFGSVLREMSLRNTEYPHMLRDTLLGLFGATRIESQLVAATGLTIAEILAMVDAADELHQQRWNDRRNLALVAQMALEHPFLPNEQEANREQIEVLTAAAFANPAEAGNLTASDLATATGLSEDKATAFLELFSLDCSEFDPATAAHDLLSGASPLRTRPIVVDSTGRAAVCHSALMVAAIRPRLEEALFAAGAEAMYTKHRGDFVEERAVRLGAGVLPSSTVHTGFEYFVPDPQAASPQDGPSSTPDGYTKLVEGDGLIVLDDIAIIVESKAVDVSEGTRQGRLGGIRRNLSQLITKTVDQAHRMRMRIEKDRGLRLRDGSWLDLSHVREIHSVAVTLEDLSGIATVTSHLVDAGLVDPDALPWIVSLHDLRIIAELVDRPSDFLFFLRRRTHPDVTRKFWAIDELDFYLHFLSTGLYVEPDPDLVASDLPHMPAPTRAERRRYEEQGYEFLTSRTGPLDDWYFHMRGLRSTPAEKPSAVAPAELLKLVDAIAATGKPGWPATVLALVEGSAEMRQLMLDEAARSTARTARDGKTHTFTALWGTSPSTLSLLVFAAVARSVTPAERDRLMLYMRAKKHQTKAAIAATILLDASGTVLDLLYDNTSPGPNAELDELLATLQPLERTAPLPPKARAREKKRQAEQSKIARERKRREEKRRHR